MPRVFAAERAMWDAALADDATDHVDPTMRTVIFRSHVTSESYTGTIHLAAGDLNDVSDKCLRQALHTARFAKRNQEPATADAV